MQRARFTSEQIAAPLLVFAIGAVLTLLVTLQIHRTAALKDQERFEHAITQAQDGIIERMQTYVAMLRAGVGMMVAQDGSVERGEFQMFVDQLRLSDEYPGVQGIGFSARIPGQDAKTIAQSLARYGVPDLELFPTEPRDEVHAIVHLEPLDERNEAALGYDMFSEPTRRAAMERARDTGAPAASGRVLLVQEIDEETQAGFLIYVPVYSSAEVPDTVEARRASLLGFVYSPFRADDLMRGIFGTSRNQRVAMRVYDGEAEEQNLLHREDVATLGRFSAERTMDIAGRTWTVAYTTRPAFEYASSQSAVRWVALAGTAATLFLTWIAAAQAIGSRRVRDALKAAQDEIEARLRVEAQQRVLLDELNHRVKNTLATVQSMFVQTLRSSRDPESIRQAFERRIVALSEAHNLLADSNWSDVELRDLILRAVAPWIDNDAEQIRLSGPPVSLSPAPALSLAVGIHELAMNAVQHGVLRSPDGKVDVTWRIEANERLQFTWRESGGPRAVEPEYRGFGLRMIERGLAHDLQGNVRVEFAPEGFRCVVSADLAALGATHDMPQAASSDGASFQTAPTSALT